MGTLRYGRSAILLIARGCRCQKRFHVKQAGGLEVMALSPTTSGAIFRYLIDDDVCLDLRSFVAWVSPRRRVYAPSSVFGQGENDLRPGETADCFAARALWAQSGALPAGHRMGIPIEGEEGNSLRSVAHNLLNSLSY